MGDGWIDLLCVYLEEKWVGPMPGRSPCTVPLQMKSMAPNLDRMENFCQFGLRQGYTEFESKRFLVKGENHDPNPIDGKMVQKNHNITFRKNAGSGWLTEDPTELIMRKDEDSPPGAWEGT